MYFSWMKIHTKQLTHRTKEIVMKTEITMEKKEPNLTFAAATAGMLFTFESADRDMVFMAVQDQEDVVTPPYQYVDFETGYTHHIDDMPRDYKEVITDVTDKFILKGQL
jgi:hypothetical protein